MTRRDVAAAVTAAGAAMTTAGVTVMWGAPALASAGLLVALFGLFAINDNPKR